jgi:hypothetical protein
MNDLLYTLTALVDAHDASADALIDAIDPEPIAGVPDLEIDYHLAAREALWARLLTARERYMSHCATDCACRGTWAA